MATNSSVAGFLAPSVSPGYGDAVDDLIQETLVALTGIATDLCRPRWQTEPPNQPAFTDDWVAFGVVRIAEDVFSYQQDGVVEKDEQLSVLFSFYGPNHILKMKRFSFGLMVAQNRDALESVGIKLVEVQEAVNLPALLKEKWVKRIDVTVVFRRRVGWTYPILNVLQDGTLGIDNEHYITPIIIKPE